MAKHSLFVSVASVSESLFSGEAESITLPGITGEMTILANHEPLITILKEGTLTIRTKSDKKAIKVTRGVLEISNNTANILL